MRLISTGQPVLCLQSGGDYSCLIEVQIRDDKVVEMSTISKNFSYGDILTSGDSFSTLTSNGFRSMSTYQYTIYSQTTDDAYVNVMTDKQRDNLLVDYK